MPGYVRAAARREQLLGAARAVLVREGLEALTLRDVAAEAQVHLSTLQYIFSSRAELVRALAERVLADAQFRPVGPGGAGLAEALDGQLAWYAEVLRDPAVVELLRHEFTAPVRRSSSQTAAPLELEQHLLAEDVAGWIGQVARRSGEEYAQPTSAIARLWEVGLLGLLHAFLRGGDPTAFRRDGALLVGATVQYASPRVLAAPRR
jgi:AcrR family transcriptional regulator